MIPVPPCKVDGVDCPKRYPGCSDHCEDFLKFRAAREEYNAHRHQTVVIEKVVFERKWNKKLRRR